MPTKKKRVGFIPRENVMKMIEKLSVENNISNSKVISILVEEALSNRGIFSLKSTSEEIPEDSLNLLFNNRKTNDEALLQTHKFQSPPSCSDLETYELFLSYLKFQQMIKNN